MTAHSLFRALFALSVAAGLTVLLAACGGGSGGETAGLAALGAPGRAKYDQACSGCHGKRGEGVPGRGGSLRDEGIAHLSDEEIFEVIRGGIAKDHPDNEIGVEMPPKGGDTTMSQHDVREVIAYVRGF